MIDNSKHNNLSKLIDQNGGFYIKQIPKELQTKELCLQAVKNYADSICFCYIRTEEICLEAVKRKPYLSKYLTNSDKTYRVFLATVKQNPSLEIYFDQAYIKRQSSYINFKINKDGFTPHTFYIVHKNHRYYITHGTLIDEEFSYFLESFSKMYGQELSNQINKILQYKIKQWKSLNNKI